MLKKTITFTDFNGTERTEDFYFNLTQAEVTDWEASESGGMSELLKKIISEQDTPKILAAFKDLIARSYGEKSLDGRRFIKSKEVLEAFQQTEAYSMLFIELLTKPEMASAFANGITPKVPTDLPK